MGIVSLIQDYRLIHGLSREEEINGAGLRCCGGGQRQSHGNPEGGQFLFVALPVYEHFNSSLLYVLYEGYIYIYVIEMNICKKM
jgi:hypothetical protein